MFGSLMTREVELDGFAAVYAVGLAF